MKRDIKEILFRAMILFLALLTTGLWIEIGVFDALLFALSLLFWVLNAVEWISWLNSDCDWLESKWYYRSGFITRAIFRRRPDGK